MALIFIAVGVWLGVVILAGIFCITCLYYVYLREIADGAQFLRPGWMDVERKIK